MQLLTKEQALRIQEDQVRYYGRQHPGGIGALRSAVDSITTADALDSGKPYSVFTINQHIPRGARIEQLVTDALELVSSTSAGSCIEPPKGEHIEQT